MTLDWRAVDLLLSLSLLAGAIALFYWRHKHKRWSLSAFTIPALFVFGFLTIGFAGLMLLYPATTIRTHYAR